MKQLMNKLGYQFKNEELLQRALTRQSAINENLLGATSYSHQALELIGDSALKTELACILLSNRTSLSEGELHRLLEPLIKNGPIMVKIAKQLALAQYLIKGQSEINVTDKMLVDTLESIVGAIYLDMRASKNQMSLQRVIKTLWGPYLNTQQNTQAASPPLYSAQPVINRVPVPPLSTTLLPTQPAIKVINSPRMQRVISSLGNKVSLEDFEKRVQAVDNINKLTIGKRGDTPLQLLLRKHKTMRPQKEIPKIEILLKHGALWNVPNKKGETAEQLVRKKHPNQANELLNLKIR